MSSHSFQNLYSLTGKMIRWPWQKILVIQRWVTVLLTVCNDSLGLRWNQWRVSLRLHRWYLRIIVIKMFLYSSHLTSNGTESQSHEAQYYSVIKGSRFVYTTHKILQWNTAAVPQLEINDSLLTNTAGGKET